MDTGKLTHLSLFTGIGGLDISAEWVGFQTVGQCEWADYPTQILEQHWPGLPRWRDIRTLTKEDFYARTGRWTVDVVSGGFPCQPFSLAGARRGTEDDRYLWPELLRVVSQLRPTWVIGENVAGLVSMVQSSQKIGVESRSINRFESEDHYEAVWARQENMLLVALLQDLERIGYAVQTFVIPACAVGARHRRDRLAIVGYAEHDGLSATAVSASADAAGHHHPKRADKASEFAGTSEPGDCADVADAHRGGHVFGQDEVHSAETGESAQCRAGGCRTDVADAEGADVHRRVRHGDAARRDGFADGGATTDADNAKTARHGEHSREIYAEPEPKGFDLCGSERRRSAQPGVGGVADGIPGWMDGYWLIEPDIPRVAMGALNRVDKLKALGNAVVPQQFYPIFAAIATIEREE